MAIVNLAQDLEQSLLEAAKLAKEACVACRNWELGGLPEPVGETAVAVLDVSDKAIRLAKSEDGEFQIGQDPESRRGRLLAAAWYLVLAGTDENGESSDLAIASRLFEKAAMA